MLLDVALATELDEPVETITPLLFPYAGRAVALAGAVMFHGITDDTLARACERLGDAERGCAGAKALATYRRIGGDLVARASGCSSKHRVQAVDRDDPASGTGRCVVRWPEIGGDSHPEFDEADAWGDVRRGAELTEREALLAEVSAATGLGGRPRTSGSGAERARVTVRKAIATVRDAIHGADPVVARHLTTRVRKGLLCCYEPDPDAPVECACDCWASQMTLCAMNTITGVDA